MNKNCRSLGTQAPPTEGITLPNRKMMPPIVPARDRQRERDRNRNGSTVVTTVTPHDETIFTTASSNDETTVEQTEETTASVHDRTTENPTVDTTVPTTSSSYDKMMESMLISAITSMEIVSTVSTAATTGNEDVIHLEDSDSDTEDDIPGEIPGIESSDTDYEDWIPHMRNESTKENTR